MKKYTEDEIYDLDLDGLFTLWNNVGNGLLNISENVMANADLQISEWSTADGYGIYVMMNGSHMSDIQWENDVYYYQPSSRDIIERIEDLGSGDVYIEDMEWIDSMDLAEHLIESYREDLIKEEELT